MIATLAICLIPIHSPTISEQSIEKVHALSLMGKRAHSDVGIHGSPGHRARRPNGNGLMGTLGVAGLGDAIELIFSHEHPYVQKRIRLMLLDERV
jgi:hypothetical protein